MTALHVAGYPYARGNRLEERNDYGYSVFGGASFLHAWMADRAAALEELPAAVADAPPPAPAISDAAPGSEGFETAPTLEYVFAHLERGGGRVPRAAAPWLEVLVQRFEVTKRLHRSYTAANRAADRGHYADDPLYVRFAEVLARAYGDTSALAYLSTLIKCLDTLCSVRHELDGELGGRLARLIRLEHEFVAELAGRQGVAL